MACRAASSLAMLHRSSSDLQTANALEGDRRADAFERALDLLRALPPVPV